MMKPHGHQLTNPNMHQAQRELAQLAALLAALVGMVTAIGFLAFGDVFLASPDANITVLGANSLGRWDVAIFAGSMIASFVAGVSFVTFVAHRATRFRRTLVLSLTTLMLFGGFLALSADVNLVPAVLLAMAMGGAHCVFERDAASFQEALSPSVQSVRLGETLVGGRNSDITRTSGMHVIYWLAFALGGGAGAGCWLGLQENSLLVTAGVAVILVLRSWFAERCPRLP